jgi:hypothetical protein
MFEFPLCWHPGREECDGTFHLKWYRDILAADAKVAGFVGGIIQYSQSEVSVLVRVDKAHILFLTVPKNLVEF